MRSVLIMVFAIAGIVLSSLAADWPQWRGADRTGKALASPKLAEKWGKDGPALVWKSEDIPSGMEGGLGSPVVVDGKVVLYFNPVTNVPITTRKVNEQILRQFLWSPNTPEGRPQPLWDEMEKARLSEDRAKLTSPGDIFKFAKNWMLVNWRDMKIAAYFDQYVQQCAQAGKPAPARADLDRLLKSSGEHGDQFPDQNAMAAWMREIKVEEAFAKKWLEANMKDKRTFDTFNGFVQDRIRRGKDQPTYEQLDRLATVKDKEFPTEQALSDWLKDQKFSDTFRKQVIDAAPKSVRKCRDSVICLDAATGKKIWRKDFDGKDHGWQISSTPTVADGKIYVIGSTSEAWCINLSDGEVIWRQPVLQPAGRIRVDSSFLLVDGLLVVLADRLQALDAATGKLKWKNEKIDCNDNSPVLWTSNGQKYVVCNTGNGPLVLVELATGKKLWDTAGGGCSTTPIEGNYMAVLSGNPEVGLSAYELGVEKPKPLWTIKKYTDRGASPLIHDGYVYAVASGKAICVELATGKEMWRGDVGGGEISSPILADGKIICPVGAGKAMVMLAAKPDKLRVLAVATVPVATCSSPAIADGKLYVRLNNCVACYDLTKEPQKP